MYKLIIIWKNGTIRGFTFKYILLQWYKDIKYNNNYYKHKTRRK